MLNKGFVLISLAGNFTFNRKYSVRVFKITLVVQFYCDKLNPWLELLQSPADVTP